MLGFIMSKMQMLLFAVGIAIVALLLLDFVSRIDLTNSSKLLLLTNKSVIDSQLSNDLLCSNSREVRIPDSLRYGYDQKQFFYDLDFNKQTLGSGDKAQNFLIMSISEHKQKSSKKSIIAAQSIPADATFVLVAPTFLYEGSGLKNSYDKPGITLYPRAARTDSPETQASSPNAFVVVKEVENGKKNLYIIPCTTYQPNNCFLNILKIGCFKLKKAKYPALPAASDLLPSCFNETVTVSEDRTRDYTWADCLAYFPSVANEPLS
jgi:hypothetical protein